MSLDNKFKGKGYNSAFVIDIADLEYIGCSPNEAKAYNSRFNVNDIFWLFKLGCSPKKADEYNKRFSGPLIAYLFKAGCPSKKADEYNKRFNDSDIWKLFKAGCLPKKADEYNTRFNGEEIAWLFKADCSPKEAEGYDPEISGVLISVLHSIGVKPKDNSAIKQKKFALLFGGSFRESEIINEAKKFKLLGTGASGFVLFKQDSAWKISKHITQEYIFLRAIHDYHQGKQKHIIKIKNPLKNQSPSEALNTLRIKKVLELEYIKGNSLENILEKQTSLAPNKVMKYASDIMYGLIEMRQAGVLYHRDIRPANILIGEEDDRAVIIDFGVATAEQRRPSQYNRRYGGANDIIALGQVIYKMTTGEHIFAESKSMERPTHAQRIKDYRDMVYADETSKLLEKHLKKIDFKIKDEKLKKLIKACLTAKNYHYKRTQKMFKKFSD